MTLLTVLGCCVLVGSGGDVDVDVEAGGGG